MQPEFIDNIKSIYQLNPTVYDYAIIGAGAAGLHLALAFLDDPYFDNTQILIVEKSKKDTNDRTWCFWEQGEGRWDSIAHRVWKNGTFITTAQNKSLDIHPYRYKMVRGIDFYNHARKRIAASDRITWIEDDVSTLEEGETVEIVTSDSSFYSRHIFDSRIENANYARHHNTVGVLQHFKGWVIETEADVFNEDNFVMMDFRLKWKNQTGFTYILPSSKRKALIEFTLFTPELIDDSCYESMLKDYIKQILKITNFKIVETEYGVIPMSSYPFHKSSTKKITKIGTAGSWVKPSSGYSFKNAERYSQRIVENIKKGNAPSKGIATGRFRKYDMLFLEVLQNNNELGEEVFTSMYLKNPASQIFKFLDEDTSILEDLKIISSFRPEPFRKALMKHWKGMIDFKF